ncbi:MAG: uroporphyrinogen-III C-methyltransferase [Neptuniibacter sp.]
MSKKTDKSQEDMGKESEVIDSNATEVSVDDNNSEDAKEPKAETETPAEANSDQVDTTEPTAEEIPTVKDEVKPEPEAPAQAKEKKVSTWPGILALLLSLIALGASGYLYWLSMQQGDSFTQNNQKLEAQVTSSLSSARTSLDKTIADMNQQLGQLKAQSSQEKQNIDELQSRLTKSIQQVTANQNTSRKDWLLAEVEYLLRLANQRVLMENTKDGALTLLKSADKILKETDDVSIYEVRKALAEDIAALEAVPTLDTEGVFLKLGALNGQVKNLRLIPISEQHKLPELIEEVAPEVVSESWSNDLKATWSKASEKLGSLVVIRHRDEPIEPLLSPEQTYYLQQNLHLMLEQAQLALLQRKQASFDASLNKAHNWISTYFEEQDATTQSLLNGLSELKSVKVTTEMPDISGSLRTLKQYVSHMTKLKEQGAS